MSACIDTHYARPNLHHNTDPRRLSQYSGSTAIRPSILTIPTSDDELSFAYRAGNFPHEPIEEARSKEYSDDFMQRISLLYKSEHYQIILDLAVKVVGIHISLRIRKLLAYLGYRLLRFRYPTTAAFSPRY